MAKTVDRLLAGVKRRAIVPASQALYSDQDLLAFTDDAMECEVVPLILSLRQDFYVVMETAAVVANQGEYDIPVRSVGRTLRDLKYRDSSSSGAGIRDVKLVALEDCHLFPSDAFATNFYFKGDKFVINPQPTSAGGLLEEWYDLKPSRHVQSVYAATVVSVAGAVVTVSSTPSNIVANSVVDFISGDGAGAIITENGAIFKDKSVASVTATTITFSAASDVPTTLAAGDYISLYQTTPVVQAPDEAYSFLETCSVQLILRALGDFEGASAMNEDKAKEEKNLKMILEPRIQGEQRVIINRYGLLHGRRSRYWPRTRI